MARQTWLANALRLGGCAVIEQPGWQNRGGDMSAIWGVMDHHTAGGGANDWVVVQNGRPGIPGPLAHMTLEKNGTFRLLAAGRCNHAGTGSYSGLPKDGANPRVIGIEGVSNGTSWTAEQRREYPKGVAAILKWLRLNESRTIGHKEWTSRKIDPGNWNMNDFRNDVRRHLGNAPVAPIQEVKTKSGLILLLG